VVPALLKARKPGCHFRMRGFLFSVIYRSERRFRHAPLIPSKVPRPDCRTAMTEVTYYVAPQYVAGDDGNAAGGSTEYFNPTRL
jgi:hypothetical protein